MAKNILKVATNVFTIVLVAILSLVIITKVINLFSDKDYSSYFGYTALSISSGSMEPELSIDDIIIVKETDDYSVGDVISYIKDDTIITHRIISISGDNIVVKGDANNTSDLPITKSDVIGKMIKVYPRLKVWKDILNDPKILVGLCVTLIIFDFVISYKKPTMATSSIDLASSSMNPPKGDDDIRVTHVNREASNKKDKVLKEDLIELTRAIDVSEIDELLREPNKPISSIIKNRQEKSQKEEKAPVQENSKEKATKKEEKVKDTTKKVSQEKVENKTEEKETEESLNKTVEEKIEEKKSNEETKNKESNKEEKVNKKTPKTKPTKLKEKVEAPELFETEDNDEEDTIRLNLRAIKDTIEKKVK